MLNSYNYIARVWEPSIENLFIHFNYIEFSRNNVKNKNFQMEIDKMNINLSDMSISFTLNSLSKWIIKLL